MKRVLQLLLATAVTITASACSLSGLVDGAEASSETKDPAVAWTPQGALAAYRGAHVLFASVLSSTDIGSESSTGQEKGVVYLSGILTDEFRALQMGADFPTANDAQWDSRSGPGSATSLVSVAYRGLHEVRAMAQEARGLLREFFIGEWRDMYAHLFAIEAYTDILLADLFCSGIPLSQVHYKGDYVLTRGYTTTEVYEYALTLFDSAEAYIRDSTDLRHFINIGRGRALVAIGQYARAAEVVRQVPDTYRYDILYSASFPKQTPLPYGPVIADGDGGGLQFISDHDPRASLPVLFDKTAPLTIASGIEARLIAVEAAIKANDNNWISGLNALRTTCTASAECPTPAPSGIGNVGGLAPLIDSTLSLTPEVRLDRRIDILFRERAYWLFLTGHRQGDLRRLVRVYGRNEQAVYPSGIWGSKGFSQYGTKTYYDIPEIEQRNPLFAGCRHQDA